VGAYVVGFALYQPTNASGDALFHPIGLDTSPGDGFTLAYAPTKAQDMLPLSPGEVDIVAAPCLAADIPVPRTSTEPTDQIAILRFAYRGGHLRVAGGTAAAVQQASRLARTACTFVPPASPQGK